MTNFCPCSFDLMAEISKKGDADAWIQRALQRGNTTAPRGTNGTASGGARAGPTIEIDMVSTNPEVEAQRRLEREAEVARMRQENALPVWLQETQDPKAQRLRAQAEQGTASSTVEDAAESSNTQSAADQEDCEWDGSVIDLASAMSLTISRFRPGQVRFNGPGRRG